MVGINALAEMDNLPNKIKSTIFIGIQTCKKMSFKEFEVNDIKEKITYHVSGHDKWDDVEIKVINNPTSFDEFMIKKTRNGKTYPPDGVILNFSSKD